MSQSHHLWNTRPSTKTILVAVALFSLAAPAESLANGFDVFGMGARGSSMASASVSNADGTAAVYYNPAGMVLRNSHAVFGVFAAFSNAEINLAPRPEGYDIPDLGPATPAIPSEYRLQPRADTHGMDPLFGLYIGATTSFGLERLRVGVLAMIPIGGDESSITIFNDEREQYFTNQLHFEVLGNRIQHQIILLALAYKVLDWLSIGAGLSFMPSAGFNSGVLVSNLTDMSNVDLNMSFELKYRFRPSFGLLVFPDGRIRGGISFRDEQYFTLSGANIIQIRGFQETDDFPVNQNIDLVLQYSPRQITLGGSVVLDTWMLALDVVLALWSDYPNNHNQPANFDDTWSPRLGFEWAVNTRNWLRLGMAYEPTPVPPQTGRTNYVDNNRLIYTAGMEHTITILGFDLNIGWNLQLQQLLARTELKTALDVYPDCVEGVTSICDEVPDDSVDPETGGVWPEAAGLQTGNPGWPGYSSGGLLFGAGLEISWDF